MKKRFCLALYMPFVLFSNMVAQNPDCPSTISVILEKQQELYVGVDNPILVSHEGLSSSEYQVKVDKGILTALGAGRFNLRVSSPGEVIVKVFVGGKQVIKKSFLARRIPDPISVLGAGFLHSDTIPARIFKAQLGLVPIFENFDFEVKCDIVDFKITIFKVDNEKKPSYKSVLVNKGFRFNVEVLTQLYEAAPQDMYIFSDINCRCSGDDYDRKLNPLVFFIGEDK